jgi:hypothetical protein
MESEIKLKHCWKCNSEKPTSDFCRAGIDSVCKTCRYALNAEWAKNNREKLRPRRADYMRAYRAKKSKEKQDNTNKTLPDTPAKDPGSSNDPEPK